MFSIGGSKQSSQSSSLNIGVQGSQSQAASDAFSQATSGGRSSQTIAFAELFHSLYGNASNAAASAAGNTSLFQGEAAQLFSGGLGFLGQLQGAGDYLGERLSGPDAAAESQLGALSSRLGDFFNEQLLPGVKGSGINAGTFGGGRSGVNTALAAKEVAGQFSQGAASILSNSQAQRDAAATAATQNAATGISSSQGLFGLASAGANAALNPYLMLSQVLGGPTTLSSSEQFGQSTSQDTMRSFADSFGLSYGTSQSSSKGKAFNFGVGGGGGATS
jgi:hypothetical protein